MRVTGTSVFSNMGEIDSVPSLNAVCRDKNRLVCGKLMSQDILISFDPDKKSTTLRQKNRLVCRKLMSRDIVTRFDPDKKSAVLRPKNRLVCGSLNSSLQISIFQISTFYIFLNLTYPLLKISLSQNAQKVTQNGQTEANEMSREI